MLVDYTERESKKHIHRPRLIGREWKGNSGKADNFAEFTLAVSGAKNVPQSGEIC